MGVSKHLLYKPNKELELFDSVEALELAFKKYTINKQAIYKFGRYYDYSYLGRHYINDENITRDIISRSPTRILIIKNRHKYQLIYKDFNKFYKKYNIHITSFFSKLKKDNIEIVGALLPEEGLVNLLSPRSKLSKYLDDYHGCYSLVKYSFIYPVLPDQSSYNIHEY